MKFILPIVFTIISIILFIFVINPSYKEVAIIKSDNAVYSAALSNSTELQKTQDNLLTTFNEIKQSDKDRLGNFLPSAVNNIQLILEIERIAGLHSMSIKDIKFESVKKDIAPVGTNTIVSAVSVDTRPYGVFPIEFTTDGKYDAFVLFLKDLELNLRLVDVKSISFSVPEVNGKMVAGIDPNIYHYIVKVETYWLK